MKTTIEIGDALLAKAKRLARDRGTTLRAIIEDALRAALASGDREHKPFKLRDASFKGRGQGLQPPFDEQRWGEVRAAIYAGRGG